MRHIIRAAVIALAVAFAFPLPTNSPLFVTAAQAEAAQIDINTAPVAKLDGLKGIGPARAAAIVKGRPYKRKDELVSKNILSQSVYDGIKDQIIAKQ